MVKASPRLEASAAALLHPVVVVDFSALPILVEDLARTTQPPHLAAARQAQAIPLVEQARTLASVPVTPIPTPDLDLHSAAAMPILPAAQLRALQALPSPRSPRKMEAPALKLAHTRALPCSNHIRTRVLKS